MKRTILTAVLLSVCIMAMIAQENIEETKPYFYEDSIKVDEIEPFSYVAYANTGSYANIGPAYTALWEESVKQFVASEHGGYFTIYHNSPQNTAEADLKWDVCIKLSKEEDDGEEFLAPLRREKWAAKEVAKLLFEGPLTEMGNAYAKLFEWVGKKGYQIAGSPAEKNLNRPSANKDGVMVGKVEIWMPVMKN